MKPCSGVLNSTTWIASNLKGEPIRWKSRASKTRLTLRKSDFSSQTRNEFAMSSNDSKSPSKKKRLKFPKIKSSSKYSEMSWKRNKPALKPFASSTLKVQAKKIKCTSQNRQVHLVCSNWFNRSRRWRKAKVCQVPRTDRSIRWLTLLKLHNRPRPQSARLTILSQALHDLITTTIWRLWMTNCQLRPLQFKKWAEWVSRSSFRGNARITLKMFQITKQMRLG